ncbi:MAG: hypothetical protein RR036_02125 [Oscillospiraceae bacterium]
MGRGGDKARFKIKPTLVELCNLLMAHHLSDKWKPFVKWFIYVLLLLILYALQTTPNLFVIFGAKPILIVALVVCVAMYEKPFSAAMFGMLGGLFWDISSDKLLGFNAIILLCCCTGISLFCTYLIRTKLVNSLAFCAITLTVQGALDFLFYYIIWKYPGIHLILLHQIIPNAIYTILIAPLTFLIVKLIATKLNRIIRT